MWSGADRAARSRTGDLPDALSRAVATTNLAVERRPLWWARGRPAAVGAGVGRGGRAGWAPRRYGLRALGLPPVEYPKVGEVAAADASLPAGLVLGIRSGCYLSRS